jgi:peptidoglycan-N-acetylglucosamine deacetylase
MTGARLRLARRALFVLLAVSLGVLGSYYGIRIVSVTPVRRRVRRAVLSKATTEQPVVALTFDDGPDPEFTTRFLDALGESRATFFLLGERVRRWPNLARAIADAGHEVACHGDTHRSATRLLPNATVQEVRRAYGSIVAVVGTPPRFYRPPFGRFNLASWVEAARLGMTRTLWTAGARDWESQVSPQVIAKRILAAAVPGAVLMLHDSDGEPGAPENTLRAVPLILAGLRRRGLSPVTLSQLVGERSAVGEIPGGIRPGGAAAGLRPGAPTGPPSPHPAPTTRPHRPNDAARRRQG